MPQMNGHNGLNLALFGKDRAEFELKYLPLQSQNSD